MRRRSRILLGTAAALALLWVLFDWNWFRPALERYLSDESRREVRADHLGVKLGFSLEPTVTFRGVYVENAPWADTRQPMAIAGEVSFTFSIGSAFEDRTVISKIVLRDADVDMERQADGLRNWRLKNPDYRGPPKIKVLRLEAYRSKLRFADRGGDFDMHFAASDPGSEAAGARSGKPLTSRIDAQGTYQGAKFTAQVLTSDVLTFRDTQEFFAVRGHAIAGNTRLDLDGEAADMFVQRLLDAKIRIAGSTLSQIHPFLRVRPARTRSYSFDAQVDKGDDEYRFTRLRGKIGETDLAGNAAYAMLEERAHWRAELKSESADLFDLRSLGGVDYPDKADPMPPDRLFPQRAFKADRLRAYDARLSLEAKKLKAPDTPALDSLRFSAGLQGGILQVTDLNLGIAAGHASGQLTLDVRKQPTHSRAALKLSGLRLERLFPSLPEQARKAGPMKGEIQMEGSGESIAAMLGAGSGKLKLEVDGGSISNLLDAKLSLNLGKIASLMFKGDREIPISCALAAVDFHNGHGKVRALLVETEQTRIEGAGALNLREESLELLLVPRPKNPGLLTLGSLIHVSGSLKHPGFALKKGTAGAPEPVPNVHCPRKTSP